MVKYFLIFKLVFLPLLNSNAQNDSTNFIQKAEDTIVFSKNDQLYWKQDSLGCLGYRAELIIKVQETILGLTQIEILNLIGTPAFISSDKSTYYYPVLADCRGGISYQNHIVLVVVFHTDGTYKESSCNIIGG